MNFKLIVLAFTLLTSGVAFSAQKITGCYTRFYTVEHLINNPDQIVHTFKLALVTVNNRPAVYGLIHAYTLAEGSRRIRLDQGGRCYKSNSIEMDCFLNNNSGDYTITASAENLFLRVNNALYLNVQDNPNAGAILDVGPSNGYYRLERVANSECAEFL